MRPNEEPREGMEPKVQFHLKLARDLSLSSQDSTTISARTWGPSTKG